MNLALLAASKSIFEPLYNLLGRVMVVLYDVWPSYLAAIVLLTVAVRLVLFPLTAKQAKSMQAMQRVQPELKRLQAKYKNDRQKLNEEMMKFYRENNINPLAGCLPLVLQMPLFIVLYRLILDLTHTVVVGAVVIGGTVAPVAGANVAAHPTIENVQVHGGTVGHCSSASGSPVTHNGDEPIYDADCAIDGASVDGTVVADGQPIGKLSGARLTHGDLHGGGATDTAAPINVVDKTGRVIGTLSGARLEHAAHVARPKHLPTNSSLYRSFRPRPGHMDSAGIDLAKRAGSIKGGLGEAFPFYVLVALTVLTGYYQQRQMTARTPANAQNQQAQLMGKIFPLFFGFISLNIPAGVVVYFVVSNVWQIGQQALIFRSQDAAAAAGNGGPPARGDGTSDGRPSGRRGGDRSKLVPGRDLGRGRGNEKGDGVEKGKGKGDGTADGRGNGRDGRVTPPGRQQPRANRGRNRGKRRGR